MTTPSDDDRPPRWMEYLPLAQLKRAPRNPKGHAQQIISQSMDVHGYVEAITIDERTGRLVAGHGRLDELEAKKAAEAPMPEGIMAGDDGEWLVPVQRGWRSKDDAQAENYLLGVEPGHHRGRLGRRGTAGHDR